MEPLQPEKRTEQHQNSSQSKENPSHSDPHCSSHKKTRDLPNLTECHACGFKVDVCTGKNGLRTLYSEWRVVLLCSKCFSSVESSRICSYCFSEASPDSFRCIHCQHSVHKNCFFKYKNTAPWSYACLGSEFSVCVDCWIPKQVAVSRSRRRRANGELLKKKGRVIAEKRRSMDDMVKDANRDVEKKAETAARAREEAGKKAAVARRAIEIANNALSLAAKRKETSLKMDAVKFFGGSVLAVELQPHVSSSPRISKPCCLLNSSDLDTQRWASSAVSSFKTSNSCKASGCDNHEVSYDNKLYRDSHKSLCEPSIYVGSLDNDSSTDLGHLCMGRIDVKTYSNDGERTAEFDAREIGEEHMKEGEGSCSDRLINYSGEDSSFELDRKQADSVLHGEDKGNGQPDRYFLKYRRRDYRLKPDRYAMKYRRRNFGLKPNQDSQAKICCDKIYLESRNSAAEVPFLKYYRRRNCRLKPNQDSQPKILYHKTNLESQDSAAGVPFSCSGELRTISDASFPSFHAPLQASACESGYFTEPSILCDKIYLESQDSVAKVPFLKYYRRRNCRLKPNQDSQPKTLYYKTNNLESQDSSAGVPFSCSGELRTISDALFHAPLPASACESGYFREPS